MLTIACFPPPHAGLLDPERQPWTDLLQPLTDAITTVRAAIDQYGEKLSKDETTTRYILIDPILRALGWDVSTLADVEVEYPTLASKKVDYALLSSDRAPVSARGGQTTAPASRFQELIAASHVLCRGGCTLWRPSQTANEWQNVRPPRK